MPLDRPLDVSDSLLFAIDVWRPAIEKFAAATNLTVSVYALDERLVCGPVFSTPLFQTLHSAGYDPGTLLECARQCLRQPAGGRPAIVLALHGVAVVGTSLVLDGRVVGRNGGADGQVGHCASSRGCVYDFVVLV